MRIQAIARPLLLTIPLGRVSHCAESPIMFSHDRQDGRFQELVLELLQSILEIEWHRHLRGRRDDKCAESVLSYVRQDLIQQCGSRA